MNWLSSAPANIMLLGEHSVVYGHPALACAVDQFIEIEWSKTEDETICIESALANFQFSLTELKAFAEQPQQNTQLDHPKLRFVIHALQAFAPCLTHGLTLKISSEFSSTIGLGSSAAVLAAMLDGLNTITQQQLNRVELFTLGHQIILTIQGRGSGTDLAASLSGGIVLFTPKTENRPVQIEKLSDTLAQDLVLTLIYCGYKTPTAEVLQMVADNWYSKPEALQQLYALMGETTQQAYQALLEQKLEHFYALSEVYQDLMESLGVNDDTLQSIIEQLRSCQSIHASKISGSGLGDCVLGFGDLSHCSSTAQKELKQFTQLAVKMTPQGAHTETLI